MYEENHNKGFWSDFFLCLYAGTIFGALIYVINKVVVPHMMI